MADAAPKPTLLELAANRFDQDILPAEQKLFKAVEKGEQADCGEGPEAKGVIRSDSHEASVPVPRSTAARQSREG